MSLPAPELEPDFRMILELSDATATVAVGDSFKNYTTFTNGVWSGRIGSGTVIASCFKSSSLERTPVTNTQNIDRAEIGRSWR